MDQVHWDRKCGFVGPGSQGAPMARRMVNAGMHVVFWARRPQSLVPYRVVNMLTSSMYAASFYRRCAPVR